MSTSPIRANTQDGASLTVAQANFHMLWGGQAEVVLSLSCTLKRRGHNVVVLTPPGSALAERASESGLEVFTGCSFPKGLRPFQIAKDVARLRAFLQKRNVQVYHCHGSQDHWIGAFAATICRVPIRIVRTRHNIYPIRNHLFNRWLFQKKTARVVTIFAGQERFFTETGLLGRERLYTLHSPLPDAFVHANGAKGVLREELKLPTGTLIAGFVAGFHPDKAPLNFLAAAEQTAKTLPNVHFCLAGFGPLEDTLRSAIEKSPYRERLHLLGFRKDILPVMASFDLVVLTSVTREASSTVLKQAGALGIPTVATDVGGTAEIVEHGRTGIIIKPGDVTAIAKSMVELLTDHDRSKSYGAAAKEKVLREFTAEAIGEKTERLYREVLAQK